VPTATTEPNSTTTYSWSLEREQLLPVHVLVTANRISVMTDVRELLRQTQAADAEPKRNPSPPLPSWNKALFATYGVLALILIAVVLGWKAPREKPLTVDQQHQEECRGNLMRFPTDLYMFLC
jgi:hypothetical protein